MPRRLRSPFPFEKHRGNLDLPAPLFLFHWIATPQTYPQGQTILHRFYRFFILS